MTTGNRCGHNPVALRACDIVRRGKGGQPQLLGIIVAYLGHARTKRLLRALDKLNRSGRRKRTEQLEAITAVCQFLVARYFQPDTRRCVIPTERYLIAPDARHIALEISKSPEWKDTGISPDRVYAALRNLVQAGYVARTKQSKEQLPNGNWISKPRIFAFTKKFFIHLGGARLWTSVRQKGKALVGRMREILGASALSQALNPGLVFSPRQAREHDQRTGQPRSKSLVLRLTEAANKARQDNKLYRFS